MNFLRIANTSLLLCAALSCLLSVPSLQAAATPAKENEQDLLAVLKSNAEPGEKAIACKKLAIFGTDNAVPALAALLPDEELSSWARIGLEAIPGAAASKALRDALPRVHGRLLVGVINSIAVRRDTKAVSPLIKHLDDPDSAVASTAAEALGRIGGDKAAKALQKTMAKGPASARGPAALGCVLCAEQYLAEGEASKARKVYDAVRAADVPRQRVLEATRGTILARGNDGIPMLIELLRSGQKDTLAIGLRTARELPGTQASAALVAEIPRASATRGPLLLLAVADRNDPSATPAIFSAAKTGPKNLRITAFGILERVGGIASIPVLLEAATENNADVAQAAKSALARLQDNAADSEIQQRLASSTGRQRQVLIQTAAQRHIDASIPEIFKSLRDKDTNVRKAAVQAIGVLGGPSQLDELVSLAQKAETPADREEIETALLAISGRSGAQAVPHLLNLTGNASSELRIMSLHALASAGGLDALNAIREMLNDSDETVQDEAVRTLSSWPNTWPDDANIVEPLLALSRDGKKPSHQVLALRGYLQYVQGEKKLKPEERIARLNDVLPLIRRPEEKRLAISVATSSAAAGALEILSQFAADTAIANDAYSAILAVTAKETPGISKEARQKALQLILDNSGSEDLKKKAGDRLKSI